MTRQPQRHPLAPQAQAFGLLQAQVHPALLAGEGEQPRGGRDGVGLWGTFGQQFQLQEFWMGQAAAAQAAQIEAIAQPR
ncbi:MAG: hypothetical protein HC915_10545 [Anaerolineae bacterium]|nr:hypothetical protein [Anaerolineae bacterium]